LVIKVPSIFIAPPYWTANAGVKRRAYAPVDGIVTRRYGRRVSRRASWCALALLLLVAPRARGDAMRAEVEPDAAATVAPAAPAPLDPAVNAAPAPLVEQAAPGGGTMVDVRGRLKTEVTETVAHDGSVRTECRAPGDGVAR
jgi:hypothetical protein